MKRGGGRGRKLSLEPLETRQLMASDVLTGASFKEVAATAGLSAANGYALDASWVDYNNDGLIDLWIGPHQDDLPSDHGLPRPNPHLFKNLGNGKFTDVYAQLFPNNMPRYDLHGALWYDMNNDGSLDLVQTVGGNRGMVHETVNHLNRVFVQDAGTFREVSYASGLAVPVGRGREAEELDANGDGLPDVFLSNFLRPDGSSTSRLYLQSARGYQPLDDTSGLNLNSADVIASQYNDVTGDGKADLVVLDSDSQLHLYSRVAGSLPPKFVSSDNLLPTVNVAASVRDFVVGDFNNDGKNDIVTVRRDSNIARVDLFTFNATTGKFDDKILLDAQSKAIVGGSITLGDYNNDQSLDLYISCEYGTTDANDYLLLNNGSGTFTATRVPQTTTTVTMDHGLGRKAITADYNNDGALDVFLNSTGDDGSAPRLLQNPGNTNRWLNIDLEGVVSTRDAVGAKVVVKAGNVTQTRYQTSGKHHFAQDSSLLHFGLGTNTKVDSIKVIWPSGRVTDLTNIATNKTLKIQENVASSRGNARTIPLTLNAGAYIDTIYAAGSLRYYRFAIAETGQFQASVTGVGAQVRIEDSTGKLVADNLASNTSVTLTKGTYYLSIKNSSTTALSFTFRPRWTPSGDLVGPQVEELVRDDTLSTSSPGITAVVNDGLFGGANIAAASLWIDTIGQPGTGLALGAVDGAFDNIAELVAGTIPLDTYAALTPGAHTLFVRAQDTHGNWGPAKSLAFTKSPSANPALELNNSFVSVAPSLLLAPNGVVADSDTTNFAGATLLVSVSNPITGFRLDIQYDSTLTKSPISYNEDRLYYLGQLVGRAWGGWPEDTITSFHLEPLVIKFTANATAEAVTAVLRHIRFTSDPTVIAPAPDRTISYLLTDGADGRTSVTQTLHDPNYLPPP